MQRSEQVGELFGALAKAQAEYLPAKKDTANPYYGSKYADLSGIMAAAIPALSKNGLAVCQTTLVDFEKKMAGVDSILAHSSGQFIADSLLLPATMKAKDGTPRFDAQSIGAAITYARRYSYQSLVGIAAEVDDDANSLVDDKGKEAQVKVVKDKLRADYVPSMFYRWNDANQTAEISGAEELKAKYAKILRPLWNKTSGTIVADAIQLDGLKYEFEKDHVIFKALKS